MWTLQNWENIHALQVQFTLNTHLNHCVRLALNQLQLNNKINNLIQY